MELERQDNILIIGHQVCPPLGSQTRIVLILISRPYCVACLSGDQLLHSSVTDVSV